MIDENSQTSAALQEELDAGVYVERVHGSEVFVVVVD